MKPDRLPKVTLVGAGPGDPDLITLKGIKALQTAKVVLYDALVNPQLLAYCKEDTELVFVGKRKGNHFMSQDEINFLLVEKAFECENVVRLKGGDPFIFGRGGEELDFLNSFGVEVAIISGISSSIAVPASVGIPLTKRRVSESFWVITGTTSQKSLSSDVALAAQSTATVVVLMGMSKLPEIVEVFKKNGKSESPVAIIQNGTTKEERRGFGTIKTIETVVEKKRLGAPAIIVIGEVVNDGLRNQKFLNELQMNGKEKVYVSE